MLVDPSDEVYEFDANGHLSAELNTFTTPFSLLLVNRAPTLGQVADQSMPEDGTLTIPLTVNDAETGAASVFVRVSAGNPQLIPPARVSVTGSIPLAAKKRATA